MRTRGKKKNNRVRPIENEMKKNVKKMTFKARGNAEKIE